MGAGLDAGEGVGTASTWRRATSTRSEGPPRRGALRASSTLAWRRPGAKALGQIGLPLAAFLIVYVRRSSPAGVVAVERRRVHERGRAHLGVRELPDPLGGPDVSQDRASHRRHRARRDGDLHRPGASLRALLVRVARRRAARAAPRRDGACRSGSATSCASYSWRLILNPDGALNWWLNGLGLPDQNIVYTNWAMWLVYTYIWLPFMVFPVYAALERIPGSYLEASSDLGARAG